jgi:D-amino-acid dehydrogenase
MSTHPLKPRLLIIGAGIVGSCCALAMQRAGWQVMLVDPDRDGLAASWGNAGHIATEQVAPLASGSMLRSVPGRLYAFGGPLAVRRPLALAPWLWRFLKASSAHRFDVGKRALSELMSDALPAWRRCAAALDQPPLIAEDGHWVCWESVRSAARGARAWHAADIGTTTCAALAAEQFARLPAPLRAQLVAGLAFAGSAQISDPAGLRRALAEALEQAGGVRRFDRVGHLRLRDGQVQAIDADDQPLETEHILLCAGARSAELLAGLGLRVPLAAERGYHLQWAEHDWPDIPPVVFEDRSVLLTRFSGGLRLCGFLEFAHVDDPPDPRKWARLAQHASELQLPVRGTPTRWYGARPTLPDYLPAIGRWRGASNLSYAFGHQHLGLTLAPITAELVARGYRDNEWPAQFGLARFDG